MHGSTMHVNASNMWAPYKNFYNNQSIQSEIFFLKRLIVDFGAYLATKDLMLAQLILAWFGPLTNWWYIDIDRVSFLCVANLFWKGLFWWYIDTCIISPWSL